VTVTSRSSPVSQSYTRTSPASSGFASGVDDVEHERLEPVVAEHVDAALEAGRVVQVGQQHREAAALVLRDEGLQRVAEVGRARPPGCRSGSGRCGRCAALPRVSGMRR
jgi:hypothetical protein